MRRIYFIKNTGAASFWQKIVAAVMAIIIFSFIFHFAIFIIAFLVIAGLLSYLFFRYKIWKMRKMMQDAAQFNTNYSFFETIYERTKTRGNSDSSKTKSQEDEAVTIEGDFKKVDRN